MDQSVELATPAYAVGDHIAALGVAGVVTVVYADLSVNGEIMYEVRLTAGGGGTCPEADLTPQE